jgi:hypothetical protein
MMFAGQALLDRVGQHPTHDALEGFLDEKVVADVVLVHSGPARLKG